jgi:hypothetical protein
MPGRSPHRLCAFYAPFAIDAAGAVTVAALSGAGAAPLLNGRAPILATIRFSPRTLCSGAGYLFPPCGKRPRKPKWPATSCCCAPDTSGSSRPASTATSSWPSVPYSRSPLTIELFRPCYGKKLEERLDELRRVQQFLGDANDCAATGRIASRLFPRAGEERRKVEEFLAARAASDEAKFRAYWREEFDGRGRECAWTRYFTGGRRAVLTVADIVSPRSLASDGVAGRCQSLHRGIRIFRLHHHVIGVVGGERQDADARLVQRFCHGDQDSLQREVEE